DAADRPKASDPDSPGASWTSDCRGQALRWRRGPLPRAGGGPVDGGAAGAVDAATSRAARATGPISVARAGDGVSRRAGGMVRAVFEGLATYHPLAALENPRPFFTFRTDEHF